MKLKSIIITMISMLFINVAFAKVEVSGQGNGNMKMNTDVTDTATPPGLDKQDKTPNGLDKQDKTPAGWDQGKKEGWEDNNDTTIKGDIDTDVNTTVKAKVKN